jgi:hypothetical protein
MTHDGNTEEENNGYVVYQWISTVQLGNGEGGPLLRSPDPFL